MENTGACNDRQRDNGAPENGGSGRLADPEPVIPEREQHRISDEVMPGFHLTSSRRESEVAITPVWYIGATRAGLTLNAPGFTTFNR